SFFKGRRFKKKFPRAPLPALCLGALFAVVNAQSRPPLISLDGAWQFAVDREGKLTINDLNSVKDWREIRVPLSWNAQFADLRDYRGVAWDRRTGGLPPIKNYQTALIYFGAADYLAEGYVHGRQVGAHEGGDLPFAYDIGHVAHSGSNEIVVRVVDPDNDKARWGDMNFNEIPHGKQGWYVQTGGIWQSARIDIKPKNSIRLAHVNTKLDGSVTVI